MTTECGSKFGRIAAGIFVCPVAKIHAVITNLSLINLVIQQHYSVESMSIYIKSPTYMVVYYIDLSSAIHVLDFPINSMIPITTNGWAKLPGSDWAQPRPLGRSQLDLLHLSRFIDLIEQSTFREKFCLSLLPVRHEIRDCEHLDRWKLRFMFPKHISIPWPKEIRGNDLLSFRCVDGVLDPGTAVKDFILVLGLYDVAVRWDTASQPDVATDN